MTPIPLPDPITEGQVKIELQWTADDRTRAAIERQARLMGKSPTGYVLDLIKVNLVSHESVTGILDGVIEFDRLGLITAIILQVSTNKLTAT